MTNGGKKMRYDNTELSVIKGTFSENDELIFALRKHFLGGKLNKGEEKVIKGMSEQSIEILSKTFFPEVGSDTALNHNIDLYSAISVREAGIDNAYNEMLSRDIVSDYLVNRLTEIKLGKLNENNQLVELLERLEDPVKRSVNLLARNTLISHIDFQLQQLIFLAGKKDETPEETIARLQKNSAK